LKITQKLKIHIILHLPRIITESVDDLVRVVTDFPKIKIVIAHLGLSKKLIPGLVEAYKKISQYNTIYMDTSMNPSGEVIKAAINSFGFKRIMYGSDEPIYLLRHSVYNNPVLGQRLITEYPYHWVNPEENRKYNDMVGGQIHSMWKSLNALKSAIDSLPQKLRLKAKKSIFHRNASEFFGF